MTEWPETAAIWMQCRKGVWVASVHGDGEEESGVWKGTDPIDTLRCAADARVLRTQFKDFPVRYQAVEFWNSVRRLKAALEGIT